MATGTPVELLAAIEEKVKEVDTALAKLRIAVIQEIKGWKANIGAELPAHAANFSFAPNARCNSCRVPPTAKNARTIISSDTEGSPASILATRD